MAWRQGPPDGPIRAAIVAGVRILFWKQQPFDAIVARPVVQKAEGD